MDYQATARDLFLIHRMMDMAGVKDVNRLGWYINDHQCDIFCGICGAYARDFSVVFVSRETNSLYPSDPLSHAVCGVCLQAMTRCGLKEINSASHGIKLALCLTRSRGVPVIFGSHQFTCVNMHQGPMSVFTIDDTLIQLCDECIHQANRHMCHMEITLRSQIVEKALLFVHTGAVCEDIVRQIALVYWETLDVRWE